jgi:hypothetical protein
LKTVKGKKEKNGIAKAKEMCPMSGRGTNCDGIGNG